MFEYGQFFLLRHDGKKEILALAEAAAYQNDLEVHIDWSARKVLDKLAVKTYPKVKTALPDFLDSHQKEGIDWILTRSRSYLAHAPGAGKTCQAIIASLYCAGMGQTVFIVPPSLTLNWKREIEMWVKRVSGHALIPDIEIIPNTKRRFHTHWEARFLIVPDSLLTKEWVQEELQKVKIVFLAVDEASRFKEQSSERTRALFGGVASRGKKNYPGLIYNARHVVLMDGSPMPNRPMELWAPTFAMAPETIGYLDQDSYGHKYCGATMNDYGRWEYKHSSNEKELKERLQKTFMHVVSEERLDHPERRRSILLMDQDVRTLQHRRWEKEHLKNMSFENVSESDSQLNLATFRKELGINKSKWVASYVQDRLTIKNESILLFAWHREVITNLAEFLSKFNPGVIMGGTSEVMRDTYIREFQKGVRKLLILNIGAAGRGHNMTRADRCIFAEFAWSNETNLQAEKRASRKGRDKDLPVRCEYIVAPNSMDVPILNAVFRKTERVKKIIG